MPNGVVVVDRMSTEVVQANLLWGVLGGVVGLFVGMLGLIGVIVGVIALALAWFWGKTSARMKMILMGLGLVSLLVGFFSMMTTAAYTALGLTPDEVSGLGWYGVLMSVPMRVDSYLGVSNALMNTTSGVPTANGVSALARLIGGGTAGTSSTGGTTGGGTTG